MEEVKLLLKLIRVAVCGEGFSAEMKQICTPEALEAAYSISADHDLAHLIGQAAGKLQLEDSQVLQKCKDAAMQAFMRYTRQEYAYQTVCEILEQGEIPFIPLKGSVLRQWYPEPWLRTSCDMDILVHGEDLDRARRRLEEAGWQYSGKSSHDISLLSPQGVHLELHHSTIEDYVSEKSKAVLEGLWEAAEPLPGKQYHRTIPDDLFYFYHMAHMAKHVLSGGCGIRSFLDIWVLNHRVEPDPKARAALLRKGGLTAFAGAAERVAEIWFSGASTDKLSESFQEFVLSGGIYGSLENRVWLQKGQEGGKLQFALKRIFQPYDILKYRFPVLQKHKWLTPVFQPVRWAQLLFGGQGKRSMYELKTATQGSEEAQAAARELLEHLGL